MALFMASIDTDFTGFERMPFRPVIGSVAAINSNRPAAISTNSMRRRR
jgi:hypothetical protein